MLNASELRIGNRLRPLRVYDPEAIPILGYSIRAKHIAYSEEDLNNDWKGIPVTPEILEKCGFISDKNGWKIKVSEQMFLWWGEYERTIRICFVEVDYSYPIYLKEPIYHFQYLHQLQNLFHSLTGEELQVKP